MATVKFKDTTLTLSGTEVKAGQSAPDFKVQKSADMSDYTLASGAGKTRIIATVPSLDTPVCDLEAKRFNEEASKLGNVEVVVVSMDLPFAQKRWCGAANADTRRIRWQHRRASELRCRSRCRQITEPDSLKTGDSNRSPTRLCVRIAARAGLAEIVTIWDPPLH